MKKLPEKEITELCKLIEEYTSVRYKQQLKLVYRYRIIEDIIMIFVIVIILTFLIYILF